MGSRLRGGCFTVLQDLQSGGPARKFDPQGKYIAHWIPEFGTPDYPEEIVDLKTTRAEALEAYKEMREVH